MMFQRKLTVFLVLLGFSVVGRAQYDTHFTHYWAVENFYNPAAMNRNDKMNIVGSYAMQMAGYTRAPNTMYFGANTVLPYGGGRHSGGAGLLNENIGLFKHKRLFMNYAFKFPLKNGWINVGAGVGVIGESFESSDLETTDPNDPAFPKGNENGTTGDISAGLLYVRKNIYLSASAQHLNSPMVKYGKEGGKLAELEISPSIYFGGGCNIQLTNPLLSVQPCFQVMSDLDFWRTDVTVRAKYEYESTMFYGGLTYSPGVSVTVLVGGKIRKVLVGYAYEIFTDNVGYQNGSHDLIISYSMDVDFFKKGKNVHKSVRYL
jgi:type IX secretion system PorP/SprF family membrane protein